MIDHRRQSLGDRRLVYSLALSTFFGILCRIER